MIKREVWMTQFGISDTDAAEWTTELESGESLLAWCLRQGKIDENAYLQWAAQTYQLPWVKDEFFLDESLQKFWTESAGRPLQNADQKINWRPDLIPLTEWDRVSYIGCLQPPQEADLASFRSNGKQTSWILASARRMGFVFRTYLDLPESAPVVAPVAAPVAAPIISPPPIVQAPVQIAVQVPPPIPAPAPQAAPTPPPVQVAVAAPPVVAPPEIEMPEGFANFDTSSFTEGNEASGMEGLKLHEASVAPIEASPGAPAAGLEMPEGMSFSMDQFEIAHHEVPEGIGGNEPAGISGAAGIKSEQPVEATFEMPEGMNIELEVPTAPPRPIENPDPTQMAVAPPPAVEKPKHGEGTMIAVRAMAALSNPQPKPVEPPVVAQPPVASPAPVVATAPVQVAAPVQAPPAAPVQVASAPQPKPAADSVLNSRPSTEPDEPSAGSGSRNFDVTNPSIVTSIGVRKKTDTVHTSFDQCHTYEDIAETAFAKMKKHFPKQMLIVFQAGEFKPWMWNGDLIPLLPDQPNSIDLNKPSIFRIVYTTKLPYHGYTKPSPVNDKFFLEWLGGVPPAHVTANPILIEGEVAGVMIGLSEKALEGRAVLADMEFWAKGVSSAFGRVFANPKAA